MCYYFIRMFTTIYSSILSVILIGRALLHIGLSYNAYLDISLYTSVSFGNKQKSQQ